MSIPFNPLNNLTNAAKNQSLSQAAYGGLLGGGPSPSQGMYPAVYTPPEPAGRITIIIDEVSNGHIIKIGSLTRVVTYQEDLVENIGAALTHAKMENKE